jgi:hypothetical protein
MKLEFIRVFRLYGGPSGARTRKGRAVKREGPVDLRVGAGARRPNGEPQTGELRSRSLSP